MDKTLYLFDIDFTLVDLNSAHLQAYHENYMALFGKEPTTAFTSIKIWKIRRRDANRNF